MIERIEGFTGDHVFLSNMYPSPHIMGGIHYPTAEHSFQAHKSMDPEERYRISQCPTPRDAMEAGRNLIELRADWDEVRESVMYAVLMSKFTFQPSLGWKLVNTGTAELIETNQYGEKFWGVSNGEGQNIFGLLLMQVRSHIRPLYLDHAA